MKGFIIYEPVDGDAEVVAPASTGRTADPVTAATTITVPYDTVWISLEKHRDSSSWILPNNSAIRRNGTRIEYKTKILWDPNRLQFGTLEVSPEQVMKDLERLQQIEKDKSTEENRKFWEYVEKTAQEAKSGNWQRGAVCSRTDSIVPQSSKVYDGYDMIGDDDDNQDVKHTRKIISTLEVPIEFSCSAHEMEAIVLPWFCAGRSQVCQSNREWPCCAEPNCRLPLKMQISVVEYPRFYPQLILACGECPPPEASVHLGRELIKTFLSDRGLL